MAIKHCSECYRAFEASTFRTFQRGEPYERITREWAAYLGMKVGRNKNEI
jgi:hypothetical protein